VDDHRPVGVIGAVWRLDAEGADVEPIDDVIAVRQRRVTRVHVATDHSYSDRRVELETVVIRWLDSLSAPP
jgi:hypothetical protein